MGFEFSGSYSHNIDAKGRATIPAAYRDAFTDGCVISINNEFNAISVYTHETWNKKKAHLLQIPESDVIATKYKRTILRYTFENGELDAQGRLLLPVNLRTKAAITKDVTFTGMGNYMEIWDTARLDEACDEQIDNWSDIINYVNEKYPG